MEFFVEFDIDTRAAAPAREVLEGMHAEAVTASDLAAAGNLVRLWNLPAVSGQSKVVGLYRADSDLQLDDLLRRRPLVPGVHPYVTQLDSHPDDPGAASLSPPRPSAVSEPNRT